MPNYRLIAIQLGEQLKGKSSVNEIERIASAIFPFPRQEHPHAAITSSRAQVVYDWVITLAGQPMPENDKDQLLQDFIEQVTGPDSPVRQLLPATRREPPQLAIWEFIHHEIQRVSRARFDHGYYADAVLAAMIEVNSRVKRIVKGKVGAELDGADLMHQAFSPKKPIVVLDDLTTESGRNIQQGYMEIFAGAMMGVRNPKAHENITISAERALHFHILASLLMHKLDEAQLQES